MKKNFKCWDVSWDQPRVIFTTDYERKNVEVGIRYELRFDGDREFWITSYSPYIDDVVIHDLAVVSVPVNWNNADICTRLFAIGKKLYYYDNSDRLICAGEIES